MFRKKGKPQKDDASRYLEGWKRARADYENLHQRLEKDRIQSRKEGAQEAFDSIFPLLDYFDAAFASIPNDITDHQWVKGIKQIEYAFHNILAAQGIEPIDKNNVPFDPTVHEAIEHVPSELPTGTVIRVLAKGYKRGEDVLRAAKVQVSAGSREQDKDTRVSTDVCSGKKKTNSH